MPDVRDHLEPLDLVEVPDLWHRVREDGEPMPPIPVAHVPPRGARVAAAAVALVAFALAAVFGWRAFHPTRRQADQVQPVTLGGVRLLVTADGPSGDQALLEGDLVVRRGCVGVGDGDAISFVLWPAGSHLIKVGNDVWIAGTDGRLVAPIGGRVRMGGASMFLRGAERAVPAGIPVSCATGGERYWLAGEVERVLTAPPSDGPAGIDIGIGDNLCDAVRFGGDLDGDGTPDRVWLGGRTLANGTCPQDVTRRRILAIDLTRDGSIDVTSTAMDCSTWCVLFSVVDLNADGIDEILVDEGHLVAPVSALVAVYELRNGVLEPVAMPDGGNRFGLQDSWQGYSGAFCRPDGTFALWSGATDGGGTLRRVAWYKYRLDPSALRFDLVGTHGPVRTSHLPPSTGYDGLLCGKATLPIG